MFGAGSGCRLPDSWLRVTKPAICLFGPSKTPLTLRHTAPHDTDLLVSVAAIDRELRKSFDIEPDDTAVGLCDLRSEASAMLRADTPFYAASVPKIAILLAYFEMRPDTKAWLDDTTRHELGLMIKQSSNEMAAKYGELVGLKEIARVLQLPKYKLYDPEYGGGLWVGKHYSKGTERNPDPISGLSHAATVRQLLHYFLLLEANRLAGSKVSPVMREIFDSPDIPHTDNKFVAVLAGRDVHILRKSGTWDVWHGDVAVIEGEGRRYILAALVHHPKGEEYCIELARRIDDLMIERQAAQELATEGTESTEDPSTPSGATRRR
jgi:beta-lactamase class A